MNKPGSSPNQQRFNVHSEDIPEALRDNREQRKSLTISKWVWLSLLVSIGAIAIFALAFFFRQASTSQVNNSVAESPSAPSTPESDPQVNNSATAASSTPPADDPEAIASVLGHRAYQEAPASDLQPIYPGSPLRLRNAAAEKFRQMVAAAQASGISLVPISGFRSLDEQKYLFFQIKEQRAQNTSKRAEVSAPPGYSEHHTGYAVDIGDGRVPASNLSTSFEQTSAFAWLQQNAARYSFELSFPRDNPQGISYEPWHWRFVGDRESLENFYKK